ncbi:hypothetical protein [Desulfospira joergensenii]|uniref:hypothetical protein n=1 Tax=Desulfospira joergensenii TaxID=53329 RepID=UPI0003B4AB05|nr:hypothetical protein [Desulfospira joergensenii]
MTTETLMGLRVYKDRNTAVPLTKDWRNIHDYFNTLKKAFTEEEKYLSHVKSRIIGGVGGIKGLKKTDAWLKSLWKKEKAPIEILKMLKVRLGEVGNGCNLTYSPYQRKTIANLSELVVKGLYSIPVKTALGCTDAGCVAYQQEIFSLLSNSGNVVINAGVTIGSNLKKEYGQIAVPEKVKVYTVLPEREANMPVQIRVKFASKKYLESSAVHSRHVEILSGILFEAGNVYTGNFGANASKDTEAKVAAHNTRQVARIAKNYPITQNDWRNLMKLFFATNVSALTFQCTANYVTAFKSGSHDIGANLQTNY